MNNRFSNGIRIQIFKSIILSQLYYGLEIYNLGKSDYNKIDVFINKLLMEIIKINIHYAVLIYRIECKVDFSEIEILRRKWKLREKLKFLNLNELISNLQFKKFKFDINWNQTNFQQISREIIKNKSISLSNSTNWKVQNYLKIWKIQKIQNKSQPYLNWPSSSIFLKFEKLANGLNRYY